MIWLQILLFGFAGLYFIGAIATIGRIGKPKATINTGKEAAYATVLNAGFIAVLIAAALAVRA